MIANKIERNGIENNIVISQKTKDLLEQQGNNNFIFEFHKDLMILDENIKSFKIKKSE